MQGVLIRATDCLRMVHKPTECGKYVHQPIALVIGVHRDPNIVNLHGDQSQLSSELFSAERLLEVIIMDQSWVHDVMGIGRVPTYVYNV